MGCEAVDIAVDSDGLDSAFPTGTHHANGDFASVGDEDSADRR
jgi:hypothetical protein